MAKKKMNEYFKKMLKAKRLGKKSFAHKGKTYVAIKNKKTGMVMYKTK